MKRRLLCQCLAGMFLSSLSGCKSDNNPDIIVVGGGGAGLAAAVSAAEKGCSVTLLEKEPTVGGNTSLSTGFFAAVDPESYEKYGVKDSVDLYVQQMMASGQGFNNLQLENVLATNAFPSLKWLEKQGMQFQNRVVSSQGSGWMRDHRPIPANGLIYVQTLLKNALRLNVSVLTGHRVIDIQQNESGKFLKVVTRTQNGEEKVFTAGKAVVIASGGFGANLEMVGKYAPQLKGLNSHNWTGNTGDLLPILGKLGANIKDLDKIQCLPGNPPGKKRRVRLHTDQDWFVLINEEGNRFIREDCPRNQLCESILSLPNRFGYTLIDNVGMMAHDLLIQKEVVLGIESGDAWKTNSIEEMADKFHVPRQRLKATIDDYNSAVDTGIDVLGRSPMYLKHKIIQPPFWGCYAGVSVHTTMGGVSIDENARCLDANMNIIEGLYACGEVTCGVHGANRLGGHGLPDAIVFGRIAGSNAANLRF